MINSVYILLKSAIERHLVETELLIDQLTDKILLAKPVQTGRPLGEIVLHMIRSLEYYTRGLIMDLWEPLPYDLSTYDSALKIKNLYDDVINKVRMLIGKLSTSELNAEINEFNRPATKAEILLEMLEHSIQHRGQILVYFRLVKMEPAKIQYIV